MCIKCGKGWCIMDNIKIIEIKQSVFKNNDEQAENLRKSLKENGVFLLNLMSSPERENKNWCNGG